MVKNPPAKAEDRRDVGQEDHLEKEMETHSSILAWKIPWTESGGLYSMGVTKSWTQLSNFHFHFLFMLLLEHIYQTGSIDYGN